MILMNAVKKDLDTRPTPRRATLWNSPVAILGLLIVSYTPISGSIITYQVNDAFTAGGAELAGSFNYNTLTETATTINLAITPDTLSPFNPGGSCGLPFTSVILFDIPAMD
jgi:hypothetical protein